MSHLFSGSATGGNPRAGLQDVLDTASVATSGMPIVGDITGLAADLSSMRDPENRTLGNSLWAMAGVLPFVPGGTISRLYRTAEDVADFNPKQAAKVLDKRKVAVFDEKANKLYEGSDKVKIHNDLALEMARKRFEKLGKKEGDLSPQEEFSLFQDDVTYGISSEKDVYSREAQAELERIRSGFQPFHQTSKYGEPIGETLTAKNWDSLRKSLGRDLTEADRKLLGDVETYDEGTVGARNWLAKMNNTFGEEFTEKFLNEYRDDLLYGEDWWNYDK